MYVGATPVFAEVNAEIYKIDMAYTERRISPQTKAVLIVHVSSMPADIDAFVAFCEKPNLALIEDAASAAGIAFKGKKQVAQRLRLFLFSPRIVITTGNGGRVTTNIETFYNRLKPWYECKRWCLTHVR
jgi:perosamine synthetase